MNKFDFVAIGDVTTDAFIALSEAHIEEDAKNHKEELCMTWGTKLPYDGVTVIPAVGNCANAAVSAARLGLSSALLSNTGDDKFGDEQWEALEKNNVSVDLMKRHEGMPSNYHYVLSFKGERTILVKHEPFPYQMPDVGTPKMFYVTSLGEHSLEYHTTVVDYLNEHPETLLAFQPGTFQMKLGKDKLKNMYERANIFFCNVEEAQKILDMETKDVLELSKAMNALGPNIVCITDGPNGAYAYDGDSGDFWFHPIYPDPKPPLDRTGAGDAFSSTFAIALASGKTIPEALAWGPINSMSVVQHYGAQEGLLPTEKLEELLANAPEHYKAEKRN